MRIAIFGNRHQEKHIKEVSLIFDLLNSSNVFIEIEKRFYDYLCTVLPAEPTVSAIIPDNNFSAQLAISIGGDGTFLRTANKVFDKGIPILGLNTGHLGYLANADIHNIENIIANILNNKYVIEERSVIEVEIDADIDVKHNMLYALNEVAIHSHDTSTMISAYTQVNGMYLTTYRGDGLIIATPTGSTAYNLSVGGPIIDPCSQVLAISPISAHSLTMRPLVVSDSSTITVTPSSRAKTYCLNLDSRTLTLPMETKVTIRKAPCPVKVVQDPNHSFIQTLRSKLMWGTEVV